MQVTPSVQPSSVALCASNPDDIIAEVRVTNRQEDEREGQTWTDVPQLDHAVTASGRQQPRSAEAGSVDALLVGILRTDGTPCSVSLASL